MEKKSVTGRWTVGPNLQNIPIRTEIGQDIANALRRAPASGSPIIQYSDIAKLYKDLEKASEWCKKEDDHFFDSAGQCRFCKAHRRPA